MAYRIPLPEGGRRAWIDIVEPNSTSVQRFIRRRGLAEYEPPTAACLLALCDAEGAGFTFFDVGANMGLYSLLVASMFEPTRVHAFEPTPDTAGVAKRIARRNQLPVEVFDVALSDRRGRATLYLLTSSESSNSMVEGFRQSDRTIEVPTQTLDEHVAWTGVHPDIVKIDVETFEPAVLAGARATIAAHRPAIVIEVLERRGRDHGIDITAAMEGFGYSYYELSSDPDWNAREVISGSGTTDSDWLLLPEPLDGDFPHRWSTWLHRLQQCTVDRNGRVPVVPTVRAAYRRGGVSEIAAAGRRYWAQRRRV